jgi:hypothetical protein
MTDSSILLAADYKAEASSLLGFVAWCASAAGVVGLLIIGMSMAVQLRRGEPGEGGTFFRQTFIVIVACLIAATAGPLVSFVNLFTLKNQ